MKERELMEKIIYFFRSNEENKPILERWKLNDDAVHEMTNLGDRMSTRVRLLFHSFLEMVNMMQCSKGKSASAL